MVVIAAALAAYVVLLASLRAIRRARRAGAYISVNFSAPFSSHFQESDRDRRFRRLDQEVRRGLGDDDTNDDRERAEVVEAAVATQRIAILNRHLRKSASQCLATHWAIADGLGCREMAETARRPLSSRLRQRVIDLSELLGQPQAFGALLLVLWTGIFVREALGSLGYPPAVYGRVRKPYVTAISTAFAGYTVVFAGLAGKLQAPVSFSVALGVVMTTHAIWMTRMAALEAYRAAPVATWNRSPLRLLSYPRFVQVTDVHLTANHEVRAEGGNAAHRTRAPAILATRPSFAFLTGDVTDRGEPEEWDEAVSLFGPFREAGCRLVLVPGNHDLSSAYNTSEAWYVVDQGFFKNEPVNWLRSARLRRYLGCAAAMDPSLLTPSGIPLKDLLERETQGFVQLNALVEQGQGALAADAGSSAATILSTWEPALRIIADLLKARLGLDD